jgi:hypothetical protein
MRKTAVFLFLLLLAGLVLANGDHNVTEGKALIDSGISCNELTNAQLEEIGEYFMEQMHPGETHEFMHDMMGMEEGTDYHEQFHIDLAKAMYCGERQGFQTMMGGQMMGPGMGGSFIVPDMLFSSSAGQAGAWWLVWNLLVLVLLVGLIVLVFLGILKLAKDLSKKG